MFGPDNCLFCSVRIKNLLVEKGRSNLSARYSMLKVLYIWSDTADDSTPRPACSIYICTQRKCGWGSSRPTHIRPLFGAGTSSLSTFRCRFPREIVLRPSIRPCLLWYHGRPQRPLCGRSRFHRIKGKFAFAAGMRQNLSCVQIKLTSSQLWAAPAPPSGRNHGHSPDIHLDSSGRPPHLTPIRCLLPA